MSDNRIEITRPEFWRLFQWVPAEPCCGVCLTNIEGTEIVAEYVFVTQRTPMVEREISELERLYSLSGH